jgi:hypothetical protein
MENTTMTIQTARLAFAAAFATTLLLGGPNLARAQQTSGPLPNDISSASSKFASTSVFVGGTSIMRVRFGAAGFTPQQRARAIQRRVNALLGDGPILPSDITVSDIDASDSAVYVKGSLLFTADRATAMYNQTSVHNLAEKWAEAMRQVLPGLTKATG